MVCVLCTIYIYIYCNCNDAIMYLDASAKEDGLSIQENWPSMRPIVRSRGSQNSSSARERCAGVHGARKKLSDRRASLKVAVEKKRPRVLKGRLKSGETVFEVMISLTIFFVVLVAIFLSNFLRILLIV